MAEVEIQLRYDVENGKLLEVQENGRVVVDREQGAQLMSVAEAVAMLCSPTLRLDLERSELLNEAERKTWTRLRRQMVRLFCAVFGEIERPEGDGAGSIQIRLRREEVRR